MRKYTYDLNFALSVYEFNAKMPWLVHRWLLLYCMLIMVFKDCQSLFLRHDWTGKCIKAGGLVYNNSWAKPQWAEMTDNCLEDSAQFRYLDNELLRNIKTEGTFASSTHKNYRNPNLRLFMYKAKASDAFAFQYSPDHRLKQTDAGSLSFYPVNVCAEPSKNTTYVDRKTNCHGRRFQQKFTFGSVAQYNTTMKDTHCSPKQRMVVRRADYGDFNRNGTFYINHYTENIDTKCSPLTNCQVKSLCGGNRSCELTLNNNLLPSQYCPDASKEIYTEYTCVDTYSSFTITAPNIRLSSSIWPYGPQAGFIEIKDGSSWRKVKEENWDENRQKMLCQHLGFYKTIDNDIKSREVEKGQEIRIGDLICYNTQPSGTSCCIHLEPARIMSNYYRMPFASCYVCTTSLVLRLFSKAIFSGNGSKNYNTASLYSLGWCASGSTPYLLIDLQREYSIYHVVVMGDKNQTRWSESYSLKYSYNKTLVDGSSAVQITGNQNGYQASTTPIYIYHARYIKIQSTVNKEFCLRVEFCGRRQSPSRVRNINVQPSNYSARVTWKLPTEPSLSSYIRNIIICIRGENFFEPCIKVQNITRSFSTNILGLKPYTQYFVEIQTEDSSLLRSRIVSKLFRTKEAAPSGPPLNVTFTYRSKNELNISWKAPYRSLWNGRLILGYQVCYSSQARSNDTSCFRKKAQSYTTLINQLQPSTKYFVTVAAGTTAGYGNKSMEISKITNGEPVNPVAISYSSLNVTIAKPATYIKEVLVIVQIGTKNPTPVEDIKTSDLKPHQANTQDPYVTAYLKADVLPLTLVIGDGKEFYSEKEKYFNQPLKQNSSYIVFLRFFEDEHTFYSTEWSSSVQTLAKPPVANIRLSKFPNQGFIEIKYGTTWRKVKEENWDKNRQNMLCQHLGFNETIDNETETRVLGNEQEFVTGNLICYNTQPSGKYCSVHLKPSRTFSNVTNMPYASCYVCKNPILLVSNLIFSGSDSKNYNTASFYSLGWCASGSTPYLLIDLQNEYHITRVVTMGDKDETKWSELYSLKYSHNITLVDGSSAVQITGNQNGYQASTTIVDIYNARYIKIQSTVSKEFCLRVELCGVGQRPYPVWNINVQPSAYSAHVTWRIETAVSLSSYIRNIIIYIDATKIQNITRSSSTNILDLKPYTTYTVGIETEDVSLHRSKIVYKYFTTKEAAPSGPPLNVTFTYRSKNELNISWKAPYRSMRNGRLIGYQVCYSSRARSNDTSCFRKKAQSYTTLINQLQPSTKYFVTVAAGTTAGYGNKSTEISKITNGEPVNPVAISYSSLNVTIAKPPTYIKEVMVIVQIATKNPTPVENIRTSDLKPYQVNTQDPYVTAYLKADVLPLTFVIGDGKEYNSEKENHFNQPLKQNSSYIVFLRFFEDQHTFYSTEWSSNVKTLEKPLAPSGPPLNVTFTYRSKNELNISWTAPYRSLWNGRLIGYQVCYSSGAWSNDTSCFRKKPQSYTTLINQLQPSTKYFVTVAAGTTAGYGNKSTEISKITNGEPVNPVAISYSSLNVTIAKPATYIKEVMVIVQIASKNPTPVEAIRTSDLTPYQTNIQDPYITAYLKTDLLPLTFMIGGGEEYSFENKTYFNQPLKQNASYIVLLRFFETQDSYYSTEWSNSDKTLVKPPAPIILKIISTGLKKYTISWTQPLLPDQQTVLKYYANYRASQGTSKTLDVSNETTSITIDVEFDKQYTFEIQVETEAGRSDVTSESWFSHSAPLESVKKTDDGYTVTMRKPREEQKIKTVALVLLKSKSANPLAPEDVKLENSPPSETADNVGFIAREFNITDFQGDKIEISLRESENNQRRKRETIEVYALAPNATYRSTQLNTDETGNRIWSYWSEPFTFKAGARGGDGDTDVNNGDPDKHDDGDSGGVNIGAAVGASVGTIVVIIVALVLAVIFFRRRQWTSTCS